MKLQQTRKNKYLEVGSKPVCALRGLSDTHESLQPGLLVMDDQGPSVCTYENYLENIFHMQIRVWSECE